MSTPSRHSITLPELIATRIEELVKKGEFADVSQYLTELARADLTRRATLALEKEALAALQQPGVEATPEYRQRLCALARGETDEQASQQRKSA